MIDWPKVVQDLEAENARLKKHMKYTIDIDAEKVVLAELTDYRQWLEQDLEKVTRTQKGFVYDFDWLEDSRILSAKIAAIILILEDYE